MSDWPQRSIAKGWKAERADSLEFRLLTRSDFDVLMGWADHEGWNPGLHDREAFWAQDPEGYVGAYFDNILIAGGSIVNYDGAFGFMGFFIVRPEYRGMGIGRNLWFRRRDALLARLDPGAAIGMDGVVDMQPFYAKGGFEHQFADIRYTKVGVARGAHPNIVEGIGATSALHRYDKGCFGFDRPRFLGPWTSQPGVRVFRFERAGEIQGWAALRLAVSGRRIGPLFANTPEAAEALYEACLNAAQGETVHLDVPMSNAHAVDLVHRHGAEPQFECARMVHGPVPYWPIDRIYGVTSFELG